jgi:hypothetical protein
MTHDESGIEAARISGTRPVMVVLERGRSAHCGVPVDCGPADSHRAGLAVLALALMLGMLGIYGLMSYTVAQQTRELGIRMALGADRRQLARLIVSRRCA